MLSKNKIKYIRLLGTKKKRDEDKVFVAEGRKLVAELLPHFQCVYLAATQEWYEENGRFIQYMPADRDVVSDDELRRASIQETPQGVLAIFRQHCDDTSLAEVAIRELCLMLDDVQNPGNLGTIVRIADWFGISHIFCSHGTADIYNSKTVQATMGSLARVSVHYCSLEAELDALSSIGGVPVFGTFLDAPSIYSTPLSRHGIIIMGNEGKGISASIARHVTNRLFIPSYPEGRETAESLNVAIATAIVCAEFRRRQ